ncbi:MAG TPA: hypothetical protein VFE94_03385 [Candidatus Paceibacterota bacterium]|nr:hypothetical protein [Candidatus Paceibacterota bacterium]
MSIFDDYIAYAKDNPKGHWFKRKLFGWGWTPVTRQGWAVVHKRFELFSRPVGYGRYLSALAVKIIE